MNGMRGAWVVLLCGALAGCFSAAPPAPPVRWFDPTPAVSAPRAVSAQLRCRAVSTVSREFVFRVKARELVYDAEHRWIAEPLQLLETALAARCTPAGDGAVVDVQLLAFEFDLVEAPRARVRVQVGGSSRAAEVVEAVHDSESKGPEDLAAAMAAALGKVADEVVARAAK